MALGLSVVISLFSLPVIRAAATPDSDTVTHIKSFSDFKTFADNCRRDEWAYGKSFVLDNDIVFDTDKMIMVASFAGTFDGNGHTISNVKIEGVAGNTGLFGIVYSSGTIKNLTVMGTYEPNGVLSRLGGIAGANHGLIENCTFSGSIFANSVMGGICGYNWSDGRIINCTSKGTLEGSDKTGGIAGVNDGTISGCKNSAKVNTTYDETKFSNNQISNIIESVTMSKDYSLLNAVRVRTDVGGIAGVNAGRIENCSNEENVGYKQVGYNTGGIAGRSMGFVSNSVNRAGIYGKSDIGGIVGQQQPYVFLDYSDSDLNGLGKGLNDLNSSVSDAMNDVSGLSTKARYELIAIADTVGRAKDQLKVITDTLGDGVDDISGQAGSLIDDGNDAVKELDQQMDRIKEDLKKLIERLHELGEEKDRIFDAIDALQEALSLKDSEKIESAYEELSKVLSDVEDDALLDTLSELGDSFSEGSDFFENLERAGRALSDINSRVSRLNGDLRSAGNDFYSTITLLVSQIKEFSNTVDDGIQSASKKINSVVATGNSVVETIGSTLQNITSAFTGGSLYQDASGEDIENAVFGRTTGSTNYGTINGDSNVGGIVGNAAIEVDLNPEINISSDVKDDAASVSNASMKSRLLIDHCINKGEIAAKKTKGGAIAGSMDTGLITDCEGYGKLTVGGNYAGGVAGFSGAEIRNSYSKLDMYGVRYVGGIVGYGNIIHDCIAMADIVTAEQFVGAVAGNVANVDSGDVYANYYYSQSNYGIDGISYLGIAEGKTFEELLSTGRLPQGFSNMTLTFEAEGKLVKTLAVPFGKGVSASDLPEVPKKEGFRGVWSKSDFSNIVEDEVILAEYTRINTLLQSELLRKGHPVMVMMGEFAPGDKLSVSEEKSDSVYDYQYHIVIPEDGLAQHQLRYQPENEGVNVYYLVNGNSGNFLFMKEAGSFGKYATIDVTGNEMDIAILEINEGQVNLIIFLLFAIPIAGAAVVILLIVRHNIKKKKAKAKA